MTRLLRTFARCGRDSNTWPVVLLLFAVLVPAVGLLWFMGAAMRNERFAARQKLAEAYRPQLSALQARLEQYWDKVAAELQKAGQTTPASVAFAKCVQAGEVDAVIIYDQHGHLLYPNTPSEFETGSSEPERKWAEAGQLEYFRNDGIAAARIYDALAKEATNASVAARAFQAEARCLVRAGQNEAAIRLIDETLAGERYRHATDSQGRLIVANGELMALELTSDRTSPLFRSIAERLRRRLMEYENPALAATQRRFLMNELQTLAPQIEFPTMAAEELAGQFPALAGMSTISGKANLRHSAGTLPHQGLTAETHSTLHRSPIAEVWQFETLDRRVMALFRSETLLVRMQALATSDGVPADVEITLAPPDTDVGATLVSSPAGARMPGWRLALSLKDQSLFHASAEHRRTLYLWTGILVVGVMGILALLVIRLMRRQMALAQLKNDLAAIVSHELKTPLSSMRVFVETLLNSEKLNEQTVREYLQLVAQENERLTRLIENFLTFSRMERKQYSFNFKPLPAQRVVSAAVHAVRERFDSPGCRFEVQADDDLPGINADPDALVAALINLLDNACKYSGDIKHIVLRATVEYGNVVFSVQDNGAGIAARETKRIFQRFYQVDPRLSHKGGGCGLGLSIVQFIVTAHHGNVTVNSRPGCGSTFTISIPAVCGATNVRTEAIA